jgi:7-cyano-7-deazaguanine synthase
MTARAIILLSGGLDSATVLALASQEGFELYALSFDYGQRHQVELEKARQLAMRYSVKRHIVSKIDLRTFGGSALTSEIEVPKNRDVENVNAIPLTYVPARNTIFLSYALAFAEVTGARDIFIGVNAVDYSGYPDCRPEFIDAFEKVANLGTKSGVEGKTPIRIRTPLLQMSKAEIIRAGVEAGVDYSLTSSCYDPDEKGFACAHCDACLLRLRGFSDAGVPDPIPYIQE